MNLALRREVTQYLLSELEGGGVPQWVVERVHEFSAGWYLFVGASASTVVPLVPWDAEEVPGRVQEFYRVLEDDLRVLGGWKEGSVAEGGVVEGGVVDGEKDEVEAEKWIAGVMERVEWCLGVLFYDRWVSWFTGVL